MKKTLAYILLLAMLMTSLVVFAVPASAAAATEIDSVDDFLSIKNNTGGNYVITVATLDFEDCDDFKSIPELSGSLTVSENIGQCTIKNLSIDCSQGALGAGLIQFLKGGTVDGLVIDSTCTLTGVKDTHHVGMVVGYASENSVIKNCVNNASLNVTTKYGVAGILGTAWANGTITVENCSNTGSITNKSTDSNAIAGGIVGFIDNTNYAVTMNIDKCVNSGDIEAEGYSAGGIIGMACYDDKKQVNVRITLSASTGDITAFDDAAGLVGQFTKKKGNLYIENCFVTGSFTAGGHRYSKGACGFVGECNTSYTEITIKNSYMAATMTSVKAYMLHFNNAQNAGGTYENVICFATATGSTALYAGGGNLSADTFKGVEAVDGKEALISAMSDCGMLGKDGAFIKDYGNENGGYPVLKCFSPCTHQGEITVTCVESICDDCGAVTESLGGSHQFGNWESFSSAALVSNATEKRACENCVVCEYREIDGTATGRIEPTEGVYLVSSGEQLVWLSCHVTSGKIKLVDNITVDKTVLAKEADDYEWEGLGTAANPFEGEFDGNEKKITLKTTGGLFDYMGACTVKNLTVDADISCREDNKTVAIIAGNVSGSAELDGIVTNGKLFAYFAAGYVGHAAEKSAIKISNSVNNAEIWSYATTGAYAVSGFVGLIQSNAATNSIENCTNNGYITSSGVPAGGIVGSAIATGKLVVKNCANTASIESFCNNQCGGILGFVNCVTEVDGCVNGGMITGVAQGTGGLVARVNAGRVFTIKNSVNIGGVLAAAHYTGGVGYISGNLNNFTASNNYSLSSMSGLNSSDAAKSSATLIDIDTLLSFRMDKIDDGKLSVKFTVKVPTSIAEEAGIEFSNLRVGRYKSGAYTPISTAVAAEPYVDGDYKVFTVTAEELSDCYITDDLIVRLGAECKGVSGAYETRICIAVAAGKLAADGYKDSEGNTLNDSYKALVDKLSKERKTIVAMGDSITDGDGSSTGRSSTSNTTYDRLTGWSGVLQTMLGTGYDVINCGNSGRTMHEHTNNSYMKTQQYKNAIAAKADIAFLMLGSNDANCVTLIGKDDYGDNFISKYKKKYFDAAKTMINALKEANPDVKIYIGTSPEAYWKAEATTDPIVQAGYSHFQINLDIVRQWQAELVAELKQAGYDITLVNVYEATNDFEIDAQLMNSSEARRYFTADNLHPNDRGYFRIAEYVYSNAFEPD